MDSDHEKKIVFSFFKQHPLMTLSTLSSNNEPQTAVLYVHVDDDFSCYFASEASTRKYANINERKQAALSSYDENLLMFGEIMGEAETVTNDDKIEKILVELLAIVSSRKSSYWMPPITQLPGDDYIVFKMKPTRVNFANYELSTSEHPTPKFIHFDF